MNGMFQYIGMVPGVNPFTIGGTSYSNSGSVSPVKIASITDGLSNTIAFSEHDCHDRPLLVELVGLGLLWQHAVHLLLPNQSAIESWGGFPLSSTLRAINYQVPDTVLSASSYHPGGANFAFADGSVRFIKETIQSWQLIQRPDPSFRPSFRPASRSTRPASSSQAARTPSSGSTKSSRHAMAMRW